MSPGRNFGHDPARGGVHRHLARDDVREDAPAILHQRNPRLVAGRFDREKQRVSIPIDGAMQRFVDLEAARAATRPG